MVRFKCSASDVLLLDGGSRLRGALVGVAAAEFAGLVRREMAGDAAAGGDLAQRRRLAAAFVARERAARSVSSIRMARLGRAIDDIAAHALDVADEAPNDWLVLEPPTEVDGPEAEAFCQWATAADRDLLLDMRGVRLLSARGARSLYGLVRASAASGHTVAACDPTPLIQLVMDVTALTAALLLTGCAATTSSGGGDVLRYKTPGSTFPIAAAVEIPTDARTVYLSGKVPPWWTNPSPPLILRPTAEIPRARPWPSSRAWKSS